MNGELINRLYFVDVDERERAQDILDENSYRWDLDGGDRLMVDDEGLDALNEESFDFDVI